MVAKRKEKIVPTIGDRVRLAGREKEGVLKSVNERGWAQVKWDVGEAPIFCHINELLRID